MDPVDRDLSSARPRLGVAVKLAALAAMLAVVPIVGLGAYVFDINKKELKAQSLLLHAAVAEGLDTSLREATRQTRDLARSVAAALTDGERAEADRLNVALLLVAGSSTSPLAGVYGRDGQRIDVLRRPETTIELPVSLSTEALAAWTRTAGRGSAQTPLMVAEPIGDPPRGFVVAPVLLDRAAEELARLTELAAEQVGEVLVLGPERELIASSHAGQRSPDLTILDDVDPRVSEKPVIRSGPFFGANGEAMFGSVISRPREGWTIVVQTPQAVAYRSLEHVRSAVAAGAGLAALLAIFAAILASRAVTQPARRLMEMVHALGARRYTTRVHISSGDELGILGDALNDASSALQASEEQLQEEAAIRQDLGRYIDAAVVDRVVRREQPMHLGGSRRHLAVLFADVVAFTPIAERMEPEAVVKLLNELFTFLTELVFKHGGTLDKFIGDGLMAIFGAPVELDDVERRAMACAEDMMAWLEVGNARWEAELGVRVRLAIGVNAGMAVVGNIGSEARMEYTAIGETINLAARLESSARPGQVLTTQAVADACPGLQFQSLGAQRFAGMQRDVEVVALDLSS